MEVRVASYSASPTYSLSAECGHSIARHNASCKSHS